MFLQLKVWLEAHKREIILFVLIFLVSTISFGLGFLMAQENNRAPIVITKGTSN